MQQQRHADETQHPKNSTRDHGQQLFVTGTDEVLVHEVRHQHPHAVAAQQKEHAHMEQVTAPTQLTTAQQL